MPEHQQHSQHLKLLLHVTVVITRSDRLRAQQPRGQMVVIVEAIPVSTSAIGFQAQRRVIDHIQLVLLAGVEVSLVTFPRTN